MELFIKEKHIFSKIFITFIFILLTKSSLYSSSATTPDSHKKFLNTQELKWLHYLQTPLKVGITQIPNQILKEKNTNHYTGYSIDLFKKLESLLHIKFQYIYYNTWNQLLRAGEKREIDIIFFAQKTEQRLEFYNFTDTVLIQHNKIMTTEQHNVAINISDLQGKKVAVVDGSAIATYIKLNFKDIQLFKSKDEADSIHKLFSHQVDYIIAEPVRVSYYIKEKNLENLYIAGDFPYNYKLRIATRNDIPIINIILNKALETITPSEKKSLALKWGYEKDVFFDTLFLRKLFAVGTILFLFLAYLTFLNRKLKKAQKQLSSINKTLEQRVQEEVQKNREKELIMLQQSRFVQMGQIINMITHQWKQPLNTLSLINQTLFLKCKKGQLSQEQLEEFYKKSSLQITQMSQTIDDFKDFFKQNKEKTTFSLNTTIENILQIVRPIFEKSHIAISFQAPQEIVTKGYPNEFKQAILNILYNAKDALLENDIENKKVEITLYQQQDKTIINIQDNGGGIKDDIIENIFDFYFSTKKQKGTGIGLHMTKIIIEQHMQGKIIAFNKDDGAVFQIILS